MAVAPPAVVQQRGREERPCRSNPFDAIAEFKGEYRCLAADLRNANSGPPSGPLEIERPCGDARAERRTEHGSMEEAEDRMRIGGAGA
jgi:hypothetical protein